MAKLRPCCKKSKTEKGEDEDLLSRLPDEILTHVLSFVSTRCAVATSVLSRRWKLLWTLVPNLQLFLYDASWRKPDGFCRKPHKELLVLFENFVDRVFSLHNVVSVRNAKLYCDRAEHDALRANVWARALVMRNAEEFVLHLPTAHLDEDINLKLFPDGFFNQKNLVRLDLRNVTMQVPPLVYFPCLKTINLGPVRFLDEESVKNLVSGCPALTDLVIHPWKRSGKHTLYICSPTLQNLTIHSLGYNEDCVPKVIIDAPKLTHLNVDQFRTNTTYDIMNVSSLAKASISYATDDDILFEFLKKISHVEELLFHRCMLKYFKQRSLKSLISFYKLSRITLKIQFKEDLIFLPQVLEYTPDRVNIVLKMIDVQDILFYRPLDLPQSISSCIESVEITEEDDRSMVSCILKSETTLKRLSFHGFPKKAVLGNKIIEAILAAGAKPVVLESAVLMSRGSCSQGIMENCLSELGSSTSHCYMVSPCNITSCNQHNEPDHISNVPHDVPICGFQVQYLF